MKCIALLVVVLVAAGCGGTKTVTVTQTMTTTVTKTVATGACKGSDLSATFAAVPGSQGAGNIVYALKVTNSSSAACQLSIASFQLLDANGADVRTNVTPPAETTVTAGELSVTTHASHPT